MHNHRVVANKAPKGGLPSLPSPARKQQPRGLASPSGYYTAMIGKYLNNYMYRPLVPPGWSEWRGLPEPKGLQLYADENGAMVRYGTDPADFKQDVLTRKAVGSSRGGRRGAAVLPLARLHGAASSSLRTRTRRATATQPRSRRPAMPTRSTPSRCRGPPTSTRPMSPTSPPRSATARGWAPLRSRTSSASTAASWNRCCRWTRGSRGSSMR